MARGEQGLRCITPCADGGLGGCFSPSSTNAVFSILGVIGMTDFTPMIPKAKGKDTLTWLHAGASTLLLSNIDPLFTSDGQERTQLNQAHDRSLAFFSTNTNLNA